jgi:hypothetical protein
MHLRIGWFIERAAARQSILGCDATKHNRRVPNAGAPAHSG